MHTQKILDLLIVTVPHDELDHPRSAPGVLRGIVQSHGFSCGTVNTATMLYNLCNRSVSKFTEVQEYFIDYQQSPPAILQQWYDRIIQYLKDTPANVIGISVFTGWSHVAAVELCRRIRQDMPGQQILLGGRGLDIKPFENCRIKLRVPEHHMERNMHHYFIDTGLADHAILGDAERSLVEFLKQEQPATRLRIPIDSVLNFPAPDFTDEKLTDYIGTNKNEPQSMLQLPVVSSKGCVRACDFCDVARFHPTYMYKPGRALYDEIIALVERHGVRDFAFVDSIANGNLKQLREAVLLLKEHNVKNPDKKITWSCNWIARPISQQGDTQFYDDLKASGLASVTVGAEHWSNDVLKAMNKKSTAEAFWRELAEFDRVKIPVIVNTITGHWSESWHDFVIWMRAITKIQRYIARGTVYAITMGSGFHLLEKTPAARDPNIIAPTGMNWHLLFYAKSNPNMGFTERIYRTLISTYHANRLHSRSMRTVISKLLEYINHDWDNIVKLQKMVPYTQFKTPEKTVFDQLEEFSQQIIEEEYKNFKIKLKIQAHQGGTGLPHIEIRFNDEIIFDQTLQSGKNNLEFECTYDYKCGNKFEIKMKNKDTKRDTVLDSEGNIIKDKFIEIDSMEMDSVELIENYNFWKTNIFFQKDKSIESRYQRGLWDNASLVIKFKQPIPIESTTPSYYYLNDSGHDIENNEKYMREIEKKLIVLDELSQKNQIKTVKEIN